MEGLGCLGFDGVNAIVKKRRSATLRRPRPEPQLVSEFRDISLKKLYPGDDGGSESSFQRKEYYLNKPPLTASKKIKKVSGEVERGYYDVGSTLVGHESDLKRFGEGMLAPAKWKSTDKVNEDTEKQSRFPNANLGNIGQTYNMHRLEGAFNVIAENKPRKVKLKVGGVTRTILERGDHGFSSEKPRSSDVSRHGLKLTASDYSDGNLPQERESGSQGDQRKESSGSSFNYGTKEDSRGSVVEASLIGKQTDKLHVVSSSEPTRKSNRVPRRRVFDDEEEDDEIRYLEKLKTSKVSAEIEDKSEDYVKKKKISKLPRNRNTAYGVDEDYVFSQSSKENRKKLRPGKESDDMDYIEEDEPGSDGEPEIKRKKHKETSGSPVDIRNEPLTTRQRALQSGKGGNGESFIEFPNGLPPAPSRKQKEKLSEVEIQAKKAEAAQRRRMQVEKQARESEAEAIRKILGQDSDKKKEEKKQKELEEKAKSAKSQTLEPGAIRWVIGPLGTVVTFADDVGLPSIFNSKPCSYPPPREKCAAPSCTNAYKYRDSKTKLPLCSLQCYRAVQVLSH